MGVTYTRMSRLPAKIVHQRWAHVQSMPRPLSDTDAATVLQYMREGYESDPPKYRGPKGPNWDEIREWVKTPDADLSEMGQFMDPAKVLSGRAVRAHQARAAAREDKYQSQALDLGDLTYGSRSEMDAAARGKHVWLYHGTSSKHVPSIKQQGLHSDVSHIDPSEVPGTYLTSRATGPASAEFYARRAAAHFGGKPAVLKVKVPYDRLGEDADDSEHAPDAARHQFTIDRVDPAEVYEVGDKRLKKAEDLAKAIDPSHLAAVAGAVDETGANLVDHTPDLIPHPAVAQGAELYRTQILNHPKRVGRKSATGSGITKKAVFQAKGPEGDAKFMVKPYHERVIGRVKGWMKYPIQGWAEMTNQALFHAGGIGHLHQKVHVDEHDMGPGHEKEPGLVVNIAPGHKPVADGGAHHFDKERHGEDVRKIAVMDFLANNHDRHGGNLLVNTAIKGDGVNGPGDVKTHPLGGAPLAIDHSRNFQYVAPGGSKFKPVNKYGDLEDSFAPYVQDSAISNLDRLRSFGLNHNERYDEGHRVLENYAPVMGWWEQAGPKIRETFHARLGQIKDPEVRDHLARNFDARADYLDERARMGLENYGTDWHQDKVPMYRPGELTDEEQRDPRRIEEQNQRQAAARAAIEQKRQAVREKAKKKRAEDKWYAIRPPFPHHLRSNGGNGDVDKNHPDWKAYESAYKDWLAKKPEGA